MKVLLSVVILVASLAKPLSVQAQEGNILTQKISWYSSRSVILRSNVELSNACTVITDPGLNKIILDQSGRLSEFVIVQHDGVWSDIAVNGAVTFAITFDEQPGTIMVEKSAEGTFITLDMSQNPSGVKRKIIVDQIITE